MFILRLLSGMSWSELGMALLNRFSFFAGGMLTKQAVSLTAKFLNDVNDSASGGQLVSVPSGVPVPPSSQTIAGDRIVLDDATALALSDTAVGTLFGGVYMYVGLLTGSAAASAVGAVAFYRSNELPAGATQAYTVTADPQPATTTPTYVAGIFINVISKGSFGWIQVAGTANVLFGAALVATLAGTNVFASQTTAGAADAGVAAAYAGPVTTTGSLSVALAAHIGTAIGLPVVGALSKVIITRGMFCGRI